MGVDGGAVPGAGEAGGGVIPERVERAIYELIEGVLSHVEGKGPERMFNAREALDRAILAAIEEAKPGKMVFVVTSGVYSDYGICGVYSTLEQAEEIVGPGPQDEYGRRVEWYALDDADDAYGPWSVTIARTGEEASAYREEELPNPGVIFRGRERALIHLMAHNEEQATKAANEKRSFLIASGVWVDGKEPIPLTEDMFKA